ncbi:MAG: ATP-binding cassette domain-containing protein, partial [Steroidobacteraceae bacterium]|nr:ATP-binding cassette domain-containing protein [Steroidobacteraceae bacterium]
MEEIALTSILLEAAGLRVAVPGRVLVDGLDWIIQAGEFCALLGGNGSGKSLLLRTLAGLRAPDGGDGAMIVSPTSVEELAM